MNNYRYGFKVKQDNPSILAVIGAVTLFIPAVTALIALAALVRGWVLSKLWAWFAVPIFGLPHINVGEAIAVSMVVGYLTAELNPNESKTTAGAFGSIFVSPLVTLAIAALLHFVFGVGA